MKQEKMVANREKRQLAWPLTGLLGVMVWLGGCTQAPPAPPQTSTPSGNVSHVGVHQQPVAVTSMTPRIPDFVEDLAAARPLPKTLPPEQFKAPSVVAAYRIAQEYPEVLAQQPCYCYCDTGFGHKSLLDCHIDMHSADCMVCMQETILAGRLHKEGKSNAEIRAAIIRGDWKGITL